MPALALKVLPYMGTALLFGGGFYSGYHLCLPRVYAAQLALSRQQKADSDATAAFNAQAAAALIAATTASGGAVARHQGRVAALQGGLSNERASIAASGAQAGEDGPVAPVLAEALAAIAAEQGPGK